MSESVLVTEKEFFKSEAIYRGTQDLEVRSVPLEEPRLAEAVAAARCRAVILGVDRYAGPLYEALAAAGGARGAIIARHGVGHDGVDKALARRHGIVVTNTPGVLEVSVAEHALWLIGCLARHIVAMDADMRAGRFGSRPGMELAGKALGVIGLGAIGRRVAAMAHFGFGMEVLAADTRPLAPGELDALKSQCGVAFYTADVDEVLRRSDVVSAHLPAVAGTRRFFNAARFAAMKSGALFVNTARGSIVDEAALYDALAAGRPAGAALDVFEAEPYVPAAPDKDLRRAPNVVLTPHLASTTREASSRMARACLGNIRHFFAGRLDRLTRVDAPS